MQNICRAIIRAKCFHRPLCLLRHLFAIEQHINRENKPQNDVGNGFNYAVGYREKLRNGIKQNFAQHIRKLAQELFVIGKLNSPCRKQAHSRICPCVYRGTHNGEGVFQHHNAVCKLRNYYGYDDRYCTEQNKINRQKRKCGAEFLRLLRQNTLKQAVHLIKRQLQYKSERRADNDRDQQQKELAQERDNSIYLYQKRCEQNGVGYQLNITSDFLLIQNGFPHNLHTASIIKIPS